MFYDQHLNTPKSAMKILEESPYVFVLTGSRRFLPEQVTQHTDYDFFATYSVNLHQDLLKAGFVNTFRYSANYLDRECILVLEKENVDVQLRKNATYFESVCKYLDKNPALTTMMRRFPKEQRAEIWNILFDHIK